MPYVSAHTYTHDAVAFSILGFPVYWYALAYVASFIWLAQEQTVRLQQRFQKLDKNHKGYLDRSDWSAL
jgi:prolipoprotein diacylglyceryltransferase